MTKESQAPPAGNASGSKPDEPPRSPAQAPLNMVTPITVHQSWEDLYTKESPEDRAPIEYEQGRDGSIILSPASMERVKKKLESAKRLKSRHLRILKAHEELIAEYERLSMAAGEKRIEPSAPKASQEPPLPRAMMEKALLRQGRILNALGRCRWHDFKRRAMLIQKMKHLLKFMDKTLKEG